MGLKDLPFTWPVALALALALAAMAIVAALAWRMRTRRRAWRMAGYVWVDADGTVRELSADESRQLAGSRGRGGAQRVFVKAHFNSRDPSGSLAGYLARSQLPEHVTIHAPL